MGTSTKDLMSRMGHDDMRGLIYQRATNDADKQIAAKLSDLVDQHRNGAAGARTTSRNDGGSDQPVPVG